MLLFPYFIWRPFYTHPHTHTQSSKVEDDLNILNQYLSEKTVRKFWLIICQRPKVLKSKAAHLRDVHLILTFIITQHTKDRNHKVRSGTNGWWQKRALGIIWQLGDRGERGVERRFTREDDRKPQGHGTDQKNVPSFSMDSAFCNPNQTPLAPASTLLLQLANVLRGLWLYCSFSSVEAAGAMLRAAACQQGSSETCVQSIITAQTWTFGNTEALFGSLKSPVKKNRKQARHPREAKRLINLSDWHKNNRKEEIQS